jgi:hypothetical protein
LSCPAIANKMSKALARVAIAAIFALGGVMKLQGWEQVGRVAAGELI